ncbi:hypothetical protein FE257_011716 [Aspergillus nanangensis]|uniref:Zn(2)-C6 fungal-type domain-containing protein n=1 Tax=Aspergillus nanangensis TaxID=2582783 RepID=A0AAD4CVG1_ASPNN|nr:hypothetical protein FE257_011716 [Aspergillus nanangensis]
MPVLKHQPKRNKKKPVACHRCHTHKVKCSGEQPCTRCDQAGCGDDCQYALRDRKLKVNESYLDQILLENSKLKDQLRNATPQSSPSSIPDTLASQESYPPFQNPLLGDRAWFYPYDSSAPPIYMGESACTAYATRLRQFLTGNPNTAHIPRTQYTPESSLVGPESKWPGVAQARLLVRVAFHQLSQVYHLFLRKSTLEQLENIYRIPALRDDPALTCKFFALFALGEVYSSRSDKSASGRVPGTRYYVRAMGIIPILPERPSMVHVESLLLLSLFSYFLNRRHSAYTLIGTTMRLGLILGLNHNIPARQCKDAIERQHRVRLWWAIYVFDRMYTSKIGFPLQISDDDIHVDMPSDLSCPGAEEQFSDTAYLVSSICLSRITGQVIEKIYSRQQHRDTFLQRQQQLLLALQDWLQNLPSHIKLRADETAPKHIVSLHLQFNQCVILTTRPILLHALFQVRGRHDDLESLETATEILHRMSDYGNLAAAEFYENLKQVKQCLPIGSGATNTDDEAHRNIFQPHDHSPAAETNLGDQVLDSNIDAIPTTSFTTEMAFLEPTMQDFLGRSDEMDFLNPEEIRKSRGSSLIEILSSNLSDLVDDESAKRRVIIDKALTILSRIHLSFVEPGDDNDSSEYVATTEDPALEDARRRRLLHALLDLISLEGIYPSLSGGVGIPLQQRVISVLPAGVIAQQQQMQTHDKTRDESLLDHILHDIAEILLDPRPSIQPVIRGRILSDIISASVDLAFNSNSLSFEKRNWYHEVFTRVVEEQDGVLQTIIFLASQFSPSLGHESQTETSNGPHFTVQSIMQTSRLLSSIPQGMDPAEYFTAIAPQLLALIDGDDPDLRKTAAYAVGNGILCKRTYGAPGTIGHLIFLEPIFKTLTAALDESSRRWMRFSRGASETNSVDILVNEVMLIVAVDRLRSLVLQPPNPGLVKRVIHPILLPLWGLACFALENERVDLHEKILILLQTYFGISVGMRPLKKLIDQLLWDGGSTWTYSMDSKSGVSLTKRRTTDSRNLNVVRLVDTLQTRTELFVKLLGADPSTEESIGDVFLYVSESWLVPSSTNDKSLDNLQFPQEKDDFHNIQHKLVSAKLAETLLDKFKDSLSRQPLKVLGLIKQIMDGEYSRVDKRNKQSGGTETSKMSLSSFANIVPSQNTPEEQAAEDDSTETLPAVFSLLSTILASPEFSASRETLPVLQSIKSTLDELVPHLPPSLAKPGTTASMLLEIHIASPEEIGAEKSSIETSDFDTHRRALANLNSELPPVQAEGFSLLSDLVKKASPILDIPSTLTLLLSIITDTSDTASNDEFIYLNAIKLIGTLASRHPRTVVKSLVDHYADRNEQATLDQRLKIGEAILRTVQDLGQALSGETAKLLGDGMITVAGRRAQKPQTQKSRRQQLEKEKRAREREERKKNGEPAMPTGWTISSPALTTLLPEGDEENDSESETPENVAHSANIIAAWAAGAASDEQPDDLRARASALSILASAVQTNIAGFGPAVLSSAVDLALSTLTLEPEDESAILRRASVVLLLDILKAVDNVRESRGSDALGFGFSLSDDADSSSSWNRDSGSGHGPSSIGNIPHMLRTLHFVESRETDSIVRGHIRVLIESLEAWLEKSLLWGIGVQGREGDDEPRLELGDQLAGLHVDPLADKIEGRPRIEEIE